MGYFQARLQMPAIGGWYYKESITVMAPNGQANIIASSEPIDESIDTARYAGVQGDLLRKEFPGYREIVFEPASVFGDKPGYIREFEWSPPDGVPVRQIQHYYAACHRGYTATATTPAAAFAGLEYILRKAMAEIRIGPSVAPANTPSVRP